MSQKLVIGFLIWVLNVKNGQNLGFWSTFFSFRSKNAPKFGFLAQNLPENWFFSL